MDALAGKTASTSAMKRAVCSHIVNGKGTQHTKKCAWRLCEGTEKDSPCDVSAVVREIESKAHNLRYPYMKNLFWLIRRAALLIMGNRPCGIVSTADLNPSKC